MNRSFGLFPGQSIDEQLGFWAKSVRVDNPGGQWVVVPGAQLNVAPYTSGVVASLIAATQEGQASATPIVGQTNTGAGQGAVVTFYDDVQPSSSGTIQTPSLGPSGQVVVGGALSLNGLAIGNSTQASAPLAAGPYNLSLLAFGITGKTADLQPYNASLLYHTSGAGIFDALALGSPEVGIQALAFPDPLRLTFDGSETLQFTVSVGAAGLAWGTSPFLVWNVVVRAVTI